MSHTIHSKGLTGGSLFYMLFIGGFCALGVILILFGIAAWTGAEVVFYNNQAVVGVKGFLLSLVLIPIAAVIYAFFNWLILVCGIWIFTRFKALNLKYKD
ncbi:MAG: hypothetical protein ACE365_05195 [Gammaproteobacteria bacterium]